MSEKRYFHAIDWMKALAIFFVLFYHLYGVDTDFLANSSPETYLHYFLSVPFSVAVPLFFTINGFLLLGKPFDLTRHGKRMTNLFCLTIFWDIVCCGFRLILKQERTTPIGFLFMVHSSDILWFLRALFVLYVFLPLIKEVFDHNKRVYYFTLCLFAVFSIGNKTLVMVSNVVDQLLHIDAIPNNFNFFDTFNPLKGLAGYSFAYFMIGGWLSEYKEWLLSKIKTGAFLSCILLGWILLFGYGILVSFHIHEIYDIVYNSYAEMFTCLMTVSIFCLFSKHLDRPLPRWIHLVAKNTLGIFCIQWPVYIFMEQKLEHIYSTSFLLNALAALLALAVCTVIQVIVKKIPILNRTLRM